MADLALRSYNTAALVPDSPFLTHFNACFPLPQNLSWKLVHLTPVMTSLVISTLAGKRLPLQQWMIKSAPKIGTTGLNFIPTHVAAHTSSIPTNPSNSNSCLPLLQGSGEVTTVEDIQSKLKHPKQPSVTWRKPSCWLDIQTLDNPRGHTS
jgi:hypothetical protein